MVYGGQSCQLTGVFASAACDQLITAVLPWPCQRGDEDAVFLDAFGGFLHGRILPHLKGMIRERMQLREWDLDDYILLRFWLFGWRGLHSQHLHPRHGGDEALRRRCHRKRHQSGDVTTKNSGRGADDAIRPSPVLSCPLGFWVSVWVKQKTPKCRVTI